MTKYKCNLNKWPVWASSDLNGLDINKASLPFNLIFVREKVSRGSGWTTGLWSLKFLFNAFKWSCNCVADLQHRVQALKSEMLSIKIATSVVRWQDVSFKAQRLKFLFSKEWHTLFLYLFLSFLMIGASWLHNVTQAQMIRNWIRLLNCSLDVWVPEPKEVFYMDQRTPWGWIY